MSYELLKLDSNQKGVFLENAVKSIEKMNLLERYKDKVKGIDGTTRIIFIREGSKYEVGIYAEAKMKKGFDQILIIKCKNWESVTIPPQEIYYFDRKIQITNAHKGNFVGAKFAASEINMANLHPKIELIAITKHPGKRSAPFVMFFLNRAETNIHEFRFTSGQGNQYDIFSESCEIIYNGKQKELELIKGVPVQILIGKIDSGFRLRHLDIYCEEVSDNIGLSDNNLIVNQEKKPSAFIRDAFCLDATGNISVSFDMQVGYRGRYTVITKESKGGTCDIGFTISLTTTD